LAFPENGGLFVDSASLHLERASLQGVKAMQKQEKEIKSRNEGNKENGGIQVIFFEAKRNYEAEMKKWERLYHDTDGWLDKVVVRRIDESKFR
jgi:uncharacterized protein YraI